MFIHSANLLISGMTSHRTSRNACVSYFLNILIDTTIGVSYFLRCIFILISLGVAIIYIILRTLTRLFTEHFKLRGFKSGVYGNPLSIKYWACQASLYVISLFIMKIIVVSILNSFPDVYVIGEWLLSWTRMSKSDALQVVLYVEL